MFVLGIETSCDETSASVITEEFRVLSNVIHSQPAHSDFGGVVPEIASREHCLKIEDIVGQALEKAGIGPEGIDLVCATSSPGLMGALLVGLSFAKGFAFSRNIPFAAVNHLDAHIQANVFTDPKAVEPPYTALVVSGGHTFLAACGKGHGHELIGNTLDDAAGEALDKAGKLMGLAYPAGREIEAIAKKGNPAFHHFPRALPAKNNLNFSFSGLKTALKNFLKKMDPADIEGKTADILASYQEAVMDALVKKSVLALRKTKYRKLLLCGGVARNGLLRERLSLSIKPPHELYYPAPEFCTDNGAMIAAAGFMKYRRLGPDALTAQAFAEFNITEVNYGS